MHFRNLHLFRNLTQTLKAPRVQSKNLRNLRVQYLKARKVLSTQAIRRGRRRLGRRLMTKRDRSTRILMQQQAVQMVVAKTKRQIRGLKTERKRRRLTKRETQVVIPLKRLWRIWKASSHVRFKTCFYFTLESTGAKFMNYGGDETRNGGRVNNQGRGQ